MNEIQKDYSRTYYEKHKEEIKRKKKERYDNDPEYRERIQKRNYESYFKNKERRDRKKKRRLKGLLDPLKYVVGVGLQEYEVLMYSTAQLGVVVGKTEQTIRLWEKKGILPRAVYRSPKGKRLYTSFQVQQIAIIFNEELEKHGSRVYTKISGTDFVKRVYALWSLYPEGLTLEE